LRCDALLCNAGRLMGCIAARKACIAQCTVLGRGEPSPLPFPNPCLRRC
jgi:hypothetical protein